MLLMLALLPTGALAEADTDDRGVPLPLEAPERVVCLYGSYAEAWLQAGGALVGVTDDAAKERGIELAEDIRIIGTNKEPNLELIVALAPDLVIGSADIANQQPVFETLESMGIRCAAFRMDTYLDYARMMQIFSGWTGNFAVMEEIVLPMTAGIERILADSAGQNHPTVLLLRAFSTGAKAKGADNLAGAMLKDLGCEIVQGYYFSKPLHATDFEDAYIRGAERAPEGR